MPHLCFINDAKPVVRVPTTAAAYATKEWRSLHHEKHTAAQTVNRSILFGTLRRSLNRQPAFVCTTCTQCGTLPVLH